MLERLLEQKEAITLYITNNDGLTNLTYSEWELVKNILNILRPFEEITKTASKEQCCISEVIPLVVTLKEYLSKEGPIFAGVGTMKNELLTSLERRLGETIFQRENLYVATFLDPRFKMNFFPKDTKGQILTCIKNLIKRKYNTVAEVDLESSEDDNIPLSDLNKENTFWGTFDSIASTSTETTKTKNMQAWENEVITYLECSTQPKDKSPFEWWEAEKKKFPCLFTAASVYLSAPAASVSSEQLFSELGNIYEPKRNRLNEDRAEMLVFLHHNIKKLNFSY
ncbi:zinc finger BED domain-containing protein 4-like [Harmonia axyridis]|uniref:zinc finger BED domain-containing protein 4-like n=1 Tax=Harmonia axyridis TaxID=115357 RepID=UPI001E2767D5|nr:zinc finger BED domain-containing protein 4-like [Harmonia axyridis]